MNLDEEKERTKAHSVNLGDRASETKGLMETEEPSIDVLQWYLKMILDNEEDPKTKK